ncbi:MAG: SdrD B-like domain-containing protein, partial [Methanoregulaceae archaeon]
MSRRLLLLLILVACLFVAQASGAAIAGLSYLDANGDGKYDTQFDSPLPGWEIRLFAQDGVLVATTQTDRNGFFVFDELPPGGTYLVEEVRPRGWIGIGGAISTVVLSSETPTDAVFHLDDDAALRVRIPEEFLVFSAGSHVGGVGPCSLVSNARFGRVGTSGTEEPGVCAAWRNGEVVPFSLGYDPAIGRVTYTVGERTTAWEIPESNRQPIMHLALHTQADAPGTRVDLFGLRVSAEGMTAVMLPDTELGGINTAIGRNPRGHDVLYIDTDAEALFGQGFGAKSFVLSGYQRIVWDPVHPPTQQTFGFVIDAGARTFPESDVRYAKFDGASADSKKAPVVAQLGAVEPTKTVKETETPEPTKTVKETETPEPTKTVKETETPEPTKTVKETETPEPTKTVKETETPEPTKTVKVTETPEPTKTVKETETPEPTKTVKETETPEPTKTVKVTETISRAVAGAGSGTGSISGSKWHDLDGDHKWDKGEPTLSGWMIYLEMQEENGSNWLPMGSDTTDANGRYSFSGLAEGHYRVYEVVPSGWEQTFPTNNAGMHNLVISNGQPSWTDQDFGNLGLMTPTPTTTTPTTTATTVEPTTIETTAEPTATITEGQSPSPTITDTPVETGTPTPVETTVEPTMTDTPVETGTPTPVETTVEPTMTDTPVETGTPTPVETTVEPTMTDTPVETGTPTPVETTVEPTMTDTPVETGTPTPVETTVEPTMTDTPVETGTPTSVETTVEPTATITEGQPPTGTLTPEPTIPAGNGTITVIKFNDLNGNGLQDDGEPGIADWLMTLYQDTVPFAVQATGSGGSTVFTNLDPAGEYLVTEETRDGWSPTTPALAHVNFSGSLEVTVRIGNWMPPTTGPTTLVETGTPTMEPTTPVETGTPTMEPTTPVETGTPTVEPTITEGQPTTVTPAETTMEPTTPVETGTPTVEPTITEAQPPTVTETPTETTGVPTGTPTPEPTITEGQPTTVTPAETTMEPTTPVETGTPTVEP